MTFFSGGQLAEADLIVDAVYAGYKTEDPVIVCTARDIADLLRSAGLRTPAQVDIWLDGITTNS